MVAPKGNEFWKLRSKHGRDKIFSSPEEFLNEAYKYFENADKSPWYKNEAIKGGPDAGKIIKIPTQRPYSAKALCIFLGITEDTFRNYENNEKYQEFFEVFKHVRDIIDANQFEGATVGAYNANIIARQLGLVDRTHNDTNINTKIPITISVKDNNVEFPTSEEDITD